ncbi:hypothetical protein [Deinococcus koreensis]|uniref:Uncharacterized protein n=1 Tax=Deinococcus koreensis TaxID=2054903 RepID=A0A2K3UVA4_9DEIO|nr:hypothetical protein [Deinococcus koreensis]PNY80469.1 hypothetical protein CVO96_02990 [Deinococcus koreensis]
MNKTLTATLTALTLAASTAFIGTASAVTPAAQTFAVDEEGMAYSTLYTESSWLAVEVPMASLGESLPRDLSIVVDGLPEGTTITLDDVTTRGESVLLHVTVERESTTTFVNSVANIGVKSGDTLLTTVSIPVMGAATGE